MKTGILNLFCAICGRPMRYNGNVPGTYYHHRSFGILCGKACHQEAEMKYARMILGHDDPDDPEPGVTT